MLKVLIAGSRDFNDYDRLKHDMFLFTKDLWDKIEIVSGTARGADQLGERYAKEHNIPVKRFPADWDTHGKQAGYLRNMQMAEYADHLICYWDGKSKGTKMMLDIWGKTRKPFMVTRTDIPA